jgi:hypothetical protein
VITIFEAMELVSGQSPRRDDMKIKTKVRAGVTVPKLDGSSKD